MAQNINWPRWIHASFAKHFDSKKGVYHLFIEGQERNTSGLEQWAEFRIDGPFTIEWSKNYFHLDVEINILMMTLYDELDLYKHQRIIGQFYGAFEPCIPMFKFGTGPDDDQSQFAIMKIRHAFRERIVQSNFGDIQSDVRMTQNTLEGHYRATLMGV